MVFTSGSTQAILQVKEVLQLFYKLSRLNCNLAKCEVYFGGDSVKYKDNAFSLYGFKEGELHVRYLGLPLMTGKLSSKEVDILVENITKRVKSWRERKLTYAGRLQLVNSVLLGVVQYWMQLFVLPKKALKRIQQVSSQFLWHGTDVGRAKVAWESVALPKKEGGLGVKDLLAWNQACTIRMLWLFLMKAGTLWVAWMYGYKCGQGDLWSLRVQYSNSWTWRRLLKLRDIILPWITQQGDIILWDSPEMLVYFVRKVWDTLRKKAPAVFWYKLVWSSCYPPRYSLLAWLIMRNAIVTRYKLLKWGKIRDAFCPVWGGS
ncbi:unnamed protein product [Linum trigynum]|uniref:Reverse transcriptase zinc-binding domain-containing protein n=1 Tax=Linum trigynum TaxID=586398 RepID=A0AAV2FYI1_9ROSI